MPTCVATVSAKDQAIRERLSGAELIEAGRRVATTLCERGMQKGDRVLILALPSTSWVAGYVGIVLAGGVAVPTNPAFTTRELDQVLNASLPAFALHEGAHPAQVDTIKLALGSDHRVVPLDLALSGRDDSAAVRDVAADDPVTILHTSGTTGHPKGVVHTHGDYARFAHWFGQHAMSSDDKVGNFLPMFHQAGLVVGFLSAAARRAPIFHIDRYQAETFWSVIDACDISWLCMMQPMPRQLLAAPPSADDHRHSLRWAFGTAGIEDWVKFQERFNVAFHSSYGSTETTIAYMTGSRHDPPVPAGRIRGPFGGALCGSAVSGWCDIRLSAEPEATSPAEFGFFEVRGDAVFEQYFGASEATAAAFTEDGWFKTGDYGYRTEAGDLYLLDRTGDLIRRNGENIAPREIEEVVLMYPGIVDCAVVGVADDVRGQEVAVFVQADVDTTVQPPKLFEHCAARLARFKVPRYLQMVESFPRTSTHKIQKSVLVLNSDAVDRSALTPVTGEPDGLPPQNGST